MQATAPFATSLARLHAKYPDDRFTVAETPRRFNCADCPLKRFKLNIGFKDIEDHLRENTHQALVEARLIRDSAVPGAVKHKRMVIPRSSFGTYILTLRQTVFPVFFQKLLAGL